MLDYNDDIIKQIGGLIVSDRADVIDLLEGSDIILSDSDKIDDLRLVDLYVDNLPTSDPLKLGTAYLIQLKSTSSFDGKVDNESVYDTYDTIYDYWNNGDEETSNFGIASTVGNLANTVMSGQQKKKYGALDLAQQQSKTKATLIQSIIEQKRLEQALKNKEIESRIKMRKALIITGASLLGILIISGIVYKLKK
jgi:hypothetical protein